MSNSATEGSSDPYAHLHTHMKMVPAPAFQGSWTTIEIQPDAFAPQKFAVGVAVSDLEGRYLFRLLDDLSKFECLYPRDDVAVLRSLLEHAEISLLRARNSEMRLAEVHFDVEAISLGAIWPTAGKSIEAVLHRLYFDVIPFIPSEERRSRDFLTLDNATVRRLVDEELKRIANLSFERLSTGHHRAIADQQTGQTHWLDFNLDPPGAAGSVISAVYKTPDRIELNFLRASRDVSTFMRLRRLGGRPGIFVMAPAASSMPSEDFARVEHVLTEQSWNLEQQGFVVSTHETAIAVAQDVWDWAKPALGLA